MTNKSLCFETIIEELVNNVLFAKKQDYIVKPYSWALYQTWKLINNVERPRESVEE